MKCFIHSALESVAVCKRCGKGMCSDCSSYTNHSGICPSCKLEDYEAEHIEVKKKIIFKIIWSVLFALIAIICAIALSLPIFWAGLIIPLIIMATSIVLFKRINFLDGEILKLRSALSQGTGVI
ncbi:MAG TPA: hypothetical protein PK675_05285 [Clostridia bacterium]|nr:hypothetical protein [Clostridia bacterium]